ncbi:rolling circle replication protein, Rep63 protein, partial [Acinetobacter baumannii]
KGHVKKGRNGGFTPFDLLQLSMYSETVFEKYCGKLFQEFAIAMKGARQLVWSRGLKALLELDEKTDEELAEETEKDAITLRTIDDY